MTMQPTDAALDKIFSDMVYGEIDGVEPEKWLFDFAEAWTLVKRDAKKRRLLLPSALKIAEEFKLIELIKEGA